MLLPFSLKDSHDAWRVIARKVHRELRRDVVAASSAELFFPALLYLSLQSPTGVRASKTYEDDVPNERRVPASGRQHLWRKPASAMEQYLSELTITFIFIIDSIHTERYLKVDLVSLSNSPAGPDRIFSQPRPRAHLLVHLCT